MNEYLEIRGAREHNLKNISVKIPRDKLTVITGLRAKAPLLLIRFTRKASAAMWKA